MLLAPGRPEALVSLRWTAPEDNGLNICRYIALSCITNGAIMCAVALFRSAVGNTDWEKRNSELVKKLFWVVLI